MLNKTTLIAGLQYPDLGFLCLHLSIFKKSPDTKKMTLKNIRLLSQQLASPEFSTPGELVRHMGAVQAQDMAMSLWAVGMRLKKPSRREVMKTLDEGRILRTHVLRPTWHLVHADDIRWMLALSSRRIKAANESFGASNGVNISRQDLHKCFNAIEKTLEGGKSKTKAAIAETLSTEGFKTDAPHINRIMAFAEAEGIICSGVAEKGKHTYALLDERVPATAETSREEALSRLAQMYFRSHSPASVTDFTWWSGLSATEAKLAVRIIQDELKTEKFNGRELLIHISWLSVKAGKKHDTTHLLPPFDEYLISYKDRSDVLNAGFFPKAFNNFGIFYPVILHNGQVIGNWIRRAGKGMPEAGISFFSGHDRIPCENITAACARYRSFMED